MSIKSLASKDPRNNAGAGGGADKMLAQTARETFMTGDNKLAEHMGGKGSSFGPGKTQGHGG